MHQPRPTPLNPRAAYYAARKAYRLACAQDAVEADEQYRAAREQYAHSSLRCGAPTYWPTMTRQNAVRATLAPRMFAAVSAQPSALRGRLPKGPRALALCDVRNRFGKFGGMRIEQRVALRRALRDVALAFPRSPASHDRSPAVQLASVAQGPTGGAATGRGAAGGCAELERAA